MDAWQRLAKAAVIVAALICLIPARALASDKQQSMMIADAQLIYASPSHVEETMQQLHSLGVDSVKVSMVWSLIAPRPYATRRPSFDAADPGDYPAGVWSRYDTVVKDARALGMGVYLQFQGASPVWARAPVAHQGPILSRYPKPSEFQQFVQAVSRRYSGSYTVSQTTTQPASGPLGLPLGAPKSTTTTTTTTLPAVHGWEIWNEPNETGWLTPWYRTQGRKKLPLQPELYRTLVDAGWRALKATGHSRDTILIGETANEGTITPGDFVRDLYCVGPTNLPLRGTPAAAVECPQSGSAASFVAAHPGLFDSSGYAHHPYSFNLSPGQVNPTRSYLTLQNLGSLERMLNQIFAAYGRRQPGGRPIYLSEWGEKSNPPNPYVHTSLAQQETWLNQGEFMTWQAPYVKALAQFELVDDGGKRHKQPGTRAYWSTFQTGLEFLDGPRKPSYAAYQIPVWVPRAKPGRSVAVWGQLRPANHSSVQYGTIQFQPKGSGSWRVLREVTTSSAEGYLFAHVPIPGAGAVRLAWLDPSNSVARYSRSVKIS